MPDSIEQITELLLEAKKNRAAAEEELAQTEAKYGEINAIQLSAEDALAKTSESLNKTKENLEAMREYRQKAEKLSAATNVLVEGMTSLDQFRQMTVLSLRKINALVELKEYDEAFKTNDELEAKAIEFEKDIDLVVRGHVLEITAWNRCGLYNHIAEVNVANGVHALSAEDLEKYTAAVEALPLGFHTEEAKKAQQDKLFGFRCYDRGLTALESPRTLEDLKALLALLDEAAQTEEHLLPTRERIAYLHGVACEEYNTLAGQFFDIDRNYEKSLELFQVRGYFEAEEITHDDFRLATDETDFRLRFLDKEALKMDESEFSVAVYAYADSIQKDDELEFEILRRYALLNGLSDEKLSFLVAAVNRLNFEGQILFLGSVLERGLIKERHAAFFHNIEKVKKKNLDLEKCAKALFNCKTLLEESLRKPFEYLLDDLLRSPHARKVVTKSARPEMHALRGEDPNAFKRPLGKIIKKTGVNSWDFFAKMVYVTFALVLPAAILVSATIIMCTAMRGEPFITYYLLAPLGLGLVLGHIHIVLRFGVDERGSAIYRRILGLLCLASAIFALCFYSMPQYMGAVKPFALTALIFGGVGGLWGFFAYKDKKKLLTGLIYVPLMLCVIAAIIMMVVAMINGAV